MSSKSKSKKRQKPSNRNLIAAALKIPKRRVMRDPNLLPPMEVGGPFRTINFYLVKRGITLRVFTVVPSDWPGPPVDLTNNFVDGHIGQDGLWIHEATIKKHGLRIWSTESLPMHAIEEIMPPPKTPLTSLVQADLQEFGQGNPIRVPSGGETFGELIAAAKLSIDELAELFVFHALAASHAATTPDDDDPIVHDDREFDALVAAFKRFVHPNMIPYATDASLAWMGELSAETEKMSEAYREFLAGRRDAARALLADPPVIGGPGFSGAVTSQQLQEAGAGAGGSVNEDGGGRFA